MFNALKEAAHIERWISDYFKAANKTKAVIGISGGKDSYVAAALLVRALSKENVLGVLMPNGAQRDLIDSISVVNHLNIESVTVNIEGGYSGIVSALNACESQSTDALKNIPPRLRMTVLYALSQTRGGLVCGTTNASELYVGYGTKHGDIACDFNPILSYTKTEVVALGDALGLIKEIVHKAPADGLSEATDEDAFGFSYQNLDSYLSTGQGSPEVVEKIQRMHRAAAHKAYSAPFCPRLS